MEELPEWLKQGVLDETLKKKYPEFSQVIKATSAPGAKKGDHYLSEIIRFTITFCDKSGQRKDISCVVKDSTKGCPGFLIEVKGIEKETLMYSKILPEMNRVLGEAISAECFEISPDCALLLEDLSSDGYRGTDRTKYLDMEHCRQTLAAIAKFHAASVHILENNPQAFSVAGEETAFIESRDSVNFFYGTTALNAQKNVLMKHPEGPQFREALEKFNSVFWEEMFHAVNTKRGFSVLNHGDLWTTNIMFKYENGVPVNAKLVDFQLTRISSPSFDLHMLIGTSVRPDIRETRLDELLDFYIEELNTNLGKLNISQRLSRSLLDQIMYDTRAIAFLYTLTLVPITLNNPDEPLQLSEVSRSDFQLGFPNGNPYEKAYSQPQIVEHLISMLKFYRKNNYL